MYKILIDNTPHRAYGARGEEGFKGQQKRLLNSRFCCPLITPSVEAAKDGVFSKNIGSHIFMH